LTRLKSQPVGYRSHRGRRDHRTDDGRPPRYWLVAGLLRELCLQYGSPSFLRTYHTSTNPKQSYWFPTSQDANPPADAPGVRFLTTPTTFCIVALAPPANGQLVINKRLPLLSGDTLLLLKPNGISVSTPWTVDAETGQLVVNVSASDIADGRFAWAFEATYRED
jgi:hypothetical protein